MKYEPVFPPEFESEEQFDSSDIIDDIPHNHFPPTKYEAHI